MKKFYIFLIAAFMGSYGMIHAQNSDCSQPAEVPFTQDFEEVTPPNLPECATVENAGTGNNWQTVDTQNDWDDYGFYTKVLRYYYSSNPANAWYFTRGIHLDAGVMYKITYSFNNGQAWEEKLKVSFGSEASSEAMTYELADHPSITSGDVQTNTVFFQVGEEGTYYFGFNAYSNANQNILTIDNIEIDFGPNCVVPSDLVANNIGEDFANISWTGAGSDNHYEVVYGETGFDLETAGTHQTVEENHIDLTDLNPDTTYQLYVKTLCTDQETDWSEPIEFTTWCTPTQLPYFENFDNVSVPNIPECSLLENNGQGNDWATVSTTLNTQGFSGNTLAYKYDLNNDADAWFFTRGIELQAGVNYEISYKYGNASSVTEKMEVALGDYPTAEAMTQQLADHPNIFEQHATNHNVVFTVEETGVYYFGFHAYSETNQYYLYVDDILVDFGPDCPMPIDMVFDHITDRYAQASWTVVGNETEWEIVYGEAGFNLANGESVTVEGNPSVMIDNLEADTTYDVYVMAICSESETSLYAGPFSFTTLVTPPSNTYLCDAIHLEANADCEGGPYTNVNAFPEYNEPVGGDCLNNFQGSNSVWFTFTAPANGEVTLTTDFDSTEFTTEMTAYKAPTDCSDLTSLGDVVGCAANGEDVEMTGLTPGMLYYVKVTGFLNQEGNFCIEAQMDDSEPVCEVPTSIVLEEFEYLWATISWEASEGQAQWEVKYGLSGFDLQTEGTSIIVEETTITLSDLEDHTEYDFYVRAICSVDELSAWSEVLTFTTKDLSVEVALFDNFKFYPNPVDNILTLTATNTIEKVEIFNLLGQSVIVEKPNTLEIQLNTEALQPGVYLMKVSIEGHTKTLKVIKK